MKSLIANGLATFVLLLACACTNIFTSFSNTQTDQALAVEAQKDIDSGSYSAAITLFPLFSTSFAAEPSTKELEAEAYAGRAGLNFVTFLQNLKNLNIATENLFLFFMKNFDNGATATNMADAEEALTLLLSIGSGPTSFTEDQLMKIVLVGMTTMGNIISNFADPTSTGSVAAGFTDTCTQIPSVTPTSAQYFGVAFNAVVMAVTQLAVDGLAVGPAQISGICTASNLASLPAAWAASTHPTYDFCNVFDPASFTANQVKGILSLMGETTLHVGIETCGGNMVSCACP